MQFISPWYFLLSIFIAVVVLFYFFRKQFEEKKISSNMLWVQVQNEWQASPWLKKLQQNLLFWLQVIALLLLMFALVRPFWMNNDIKGEHLIFIIDSSASMSANYEGETRFDSAKEEMLQLVSGLNGQELTIIKAGMKPEIVLTKEKDQAEISKRLEELEISYDHEGMDKAINLALSLSSGKDTSIHIFSDSVNSKQLTDVSNGQYIEVHNFGKQMDNLSLQSFGVALLDGKINGVAVIENQSQKKKKTKITISSGNELLFEQQISIKADEPFILQIPSLPKREYYDAVIQTEDGYSADNHLSTIFTEATPAIYTIGDVNPFVAKGFQTIGVDVYQTGVKNSDNDKNGIVVTEGNSLTDLPKEPLLLFHTSNQKKPIRESIVAEKDPLLQYVNPEQIYIASTGDSLEGDWETVLKSGTRSLIQKGRINGQPIIIVNFSLSDSDWPLQPSFPIFLYNCYQWLSQQTNFLGYFSPGEEKSLSVDRDAAKWAIFNDKDENLYSLDLTAESFKAPMIPGTYQAISGENRSYFSVVLDGREKNPGIEPSFQLNEQNTEGKAEFKTINDEMWFWFSLIALLLIAIEWEVYRRGYRG